MVPVRTAEVFHSSEGRRTNQGIVVDAIPELLVLLRHTRVETSKVIFTTEVYSTTSSRLLLQVHQGYWPAKYAVLLYDFSDSVALSTVVTDGR